MTIDLDPKRCEIRDAARKYISGLVTGLALKETVDTSYSHEDDEANADTQA